MSTTPEAAGSPVPAPDDSAAPARPAGPQGMASQLAESERRFLQLAENISEVFWMVDPVRQQVIYINPAYERVWGRSCASLYDRPRSFLDAIHPEDRTRAERILARQIDGEAVEVEYRILRPDGEVRWIWDRGLPRFDDAGQVVMLTGIATDITERKRIEAELRRLNAELEQRVAERTAELEDLYNHAPCGYHTLDADGVIVRINDTELGWLGYPREEVVGRMRLTDLLHEHSLAVFEKSFPAFKEHGSLRDLELEMVRRDGSSFTVLVNALALYDAGGRFRQSRTTLFDITERKRMEKALRESEQRWQFALEGSGDGVWDWNLSTNQVVYSRRWKEMLGYAEHEITDHADEWLRRIHSDDKDQVFRNLNRHLSGEIPDYEAEHRLRCRDGGYKWILTRGMVIERDTEGKPLRVIGTHSDISTRKQAEEELRHSRDRLQAANAELARAGRLKDEFLASMSHELRTPLTAILGLTEALREDIYGPVAQAQQTPLRMIEDSGRHLLALINDILDLAKIEAGQVELDLTPCELTEIGQVSLHLVKGMAAKKRQQLAFAVTPPGLMARVDGRRLKQILANLLSNAVKFTPEGGRIGLEITGDQDAGVVRMAVWDTGIGIAAEDMPRLFQTFVQLDGRLARQYEGTGLGLVLVKRMMELHGGTVSVESTPGQGSRFTLTLPWTSLAMETPGAVDMGKHGGSPVAPAPSALILLAEDNDLNRIAYARYLQVKGFRVAEAMDGLEAVDKARTLKPALILMDIQMPRLSGLEAIQQLRADADPALARVPIIALTALAMPGDRERCLAAGADEYLSKPVALRDLLAAVARRLRG